MKTVDGDIERPGASEHQVDVLGEEAQFQLGQKPDTDGQGGGTRRLMS